MSEYRDEEWLREQYVEQGNSMADIAEATGVSTTTIKRWIDRHGIESRSLSEARADGDVEQLQDEEWLREQYCDRERTMEDIASEVGVYGSTVNDWLDRHGIPTRSEAEAKADGNIAPLQDDDWLREQYRDQERSTYDIGDELGVSGNTVRRYLRRHGIEIRSNSAAHTDSDINNLRDETWLRKQYWNKERTLKEIAAGLGTTGKTVGKWLERHGIDARGRSEAQTDADLQRLRDEDWLREQYWEQERILEDIADEVGASPRTVMLYMDRHGIERRSIPQSQTDGEIAPLMDAEWLRQQYIEQYRSISDIASELGVSRPAVRSWLEKHDIEIRSRVYQPDDLPHVVRSDWELKVARLLRDHDIKYEYESLQVEYGDGRTYTPDFVTDEYVIEVKGRIFEDSDEEVKARAAMDQLEEREYVVVGTALPAAHHIPYDDRIALIDLLRDYKGV